jgi:hypothetical protein
MTWRTVSEKRGTWRERDKPGCPGTVERELISGGNSLIRGGGTCTVVEGGRRRSTPALPKFFPTLEPSYQVALSASAGSLIRSEI